MAEAYQFLADLFLGEPGGRTAEFVVATWDGVPALGFKTDALPEGVRVPLHQLTAYVRALDVQDSLSAGLEIAAEHAMLFVGPKPPLLHPYESVYRDRLQAGGQVFDHLLMGESVDRIRALWARAGIQPVNPRNLLPDHLGLELAFMAALLDMSAEGEGASDGSASEVRDELLRDHLLQWVPEFCTDAEKCPEARFYSIACEAVGGLLNASAAG